MDYDTILVKFLWIGRIFIVAIMAPKKSHIWSFFTVIDDNKAKCNSCSAIQSTKSGSTGNLLRHCRNKHPSIPLASDSDIRIVVVEEDDTPQEELTGQVDDVVPENSVEVDGIIDVDAEPSSDTGATAKKRKRPAQNQSIIRQYTHKKLSKSSQQAVDNALLAFIVKDFQAFSIVECASFRQFVATLNPTYRLPARKTLSQTWLTCRFAEVQGKVKADLEKVLAVCITTDAWTSKNHDSYHAITCHFVDADADALKSILLSCFITTERHTSAKLQLEILNVLAEYQLRHKVVAMVTDNASNIVGAVDLMKIVHISCFAHTLNLGVKDGLEVVDDLLTKVKNIVAHFKRSTAASNELIKTQKEKKQPVLKVKQSMPTRWNSSMHMLQRMVEVS